MGVYGCAFCVPNYIGYCLQRRRVRNISAVMLHLALIVRVGTPRCSWARTVGSSLAATFLWMAE